MSILITFLGTAGAIPTKERSLPAVLVQRENELIMFDCGEGVQRQMIMAKKGLHKPLKILISHIHGDHVLGLPGLLQTMTLHNREKKVEIYGPIGIKKFLKCIKETLNFKSTYPLEVQELCDEEIVCNEEKYQIKAIKSNHLIPSFSYSFVEKDRPGKFFPEKATALKVPKGKKWSMLQHGKKVELPNNVIIEPYQVTGPPRKGRKIVYSGDTKPFDKFSKFASDADLIILEATFDDSLAQKADEDGHSTSSQAAYMAKKARAKKLVLTHISSRYKNPQIILDQSKKIFKKTCVAKDFLEIKLPLK